MQVRISGTIAPELKQFISQISSERNIPKSRILENALRLLQQKLMNEKLKAGYLTDNDEALEFASKAEKITDLYE